MKKNKRIKKLSVLYYVVCMLISGSGLYSIFESTNKKNNNPYHDVTIDLNAMNEDEKISYLYKFFNELSNYELIDNIKKDNPFIIHDLVQVCLNNKYIDYNDLSDSIAVTKVYYQNEKSNNNPHGIKSEFFGNKIIKIYNQPNDLTNSLSYHEMLHVLFPRIEDLLFFEETITDIITNERLSYDSCYQLITPITNMWIETLGEDVFMKMRATGKIDSFEESLRGLGYNQKEVDDVLTNLKNILNNLRQYNDFNLDVNDDKTSTEIKNYLRNLLEKNIDIAIKNVGKAYQRQYGRKLTDNIIMQTYLNNINIYFNQVDQYYYYHTYYFTSNEEVNKVTWYDENNERQTITLTENDYNLENGEPKKLQKTR